jgi:hypothetical protein
MLKQNGGDNAAANASQKQAYSLPWVFNVEYVFGGLPVVFLHRHRSFQR